MKMGIIKYIIIIICLIIVAIAIMRSKKKDFELDANKLIQNLGGKENLINYEVNKSRFIVTLKDVSKADKEAIQKMGAKGILEVDNQLKIVLGNNANKLIKCINDLK